MAETHVVSALVAKRSELAGFIADLEKRAAQHRADLGHVDAVLRLYGEAKPEAIRPKRVTQRNAWFSPGECARLVYDTLRPAEKPVGTREITEAAMTAKGLDFSDERIRAMVQKTILATLSDGAVRQDTARRYRTNRRSAPPWPPGAPPG